MYSPWTGSDLHSQLPSAGVDTVVVTGDETDVCVLATVLGAVDWGFRVVLVTDAICGSADETHDSMMTIYMNPFPAGGVRDDGNPPRQLARRHPCERSAMTGSYLVQILLPKETGQGEKIPKDWFDSLVKEMTDKFGGATSFVRSPGEGLWRGDGGTERDNIAVIEVMTERLVPEYWRALRERLETELAQKEIVIRAQEIIPL
ncbi:hypothetical protein ABIF74_000288 [Bradyrhizobium japonicum]